MNIESTAPRARWTRRRFLRVAGSAGAAAGASALLAACGSNGEGQAGSRVVSPTDPPVARAEARRRRAGAPVRDIALVAAATTIDLAGRSVRTRAFGGQVPGKVVRANAGDVLRIAFRNDLDVATTLHWHGIALRNDMDGVPDLTQGNVGAGSTFTYEFTVPDAGTYWFHPHVGVQLDNGLYAPLIVDDPRERGDYDEEWIVLVDDWTDGVGPSPDARLRALLRGAAAPMRPPMGGMPGMGTTTTTMGGMPGMGATTTTDAGGGPADDTGGEDASRLLRGDAGDIRYPLYLLNGRPVDDPETRVSRPGRRVRLRMINAAADTAFRLALGGHRMTVTHTDGFPVEPTTTDAVLLTMGERVDATVTLGDGTFPFVALAEGKAAQARAVVRTGTGRTPAAAVRPRELDGRVVTVADLRATAAVALDAGAPDRTLRAVLRGDMTSYRWTINGRAFPDVTPLGVRAGERVRLEFENRSMMFHPMHLHGHTFGVVAAGGGPRKDTVAVLPGQRLAVDLDADNPGQWALHCHNAYHAEAGMLTVLSYRR